jgi:sugar lactone lactonase YvrE
LGKGQPTDLAVDSKGNLWVIEAANGIIWSIAADGTVLKTVRVSQSGSEDGPHLAVDGKDNLWVTDPDGIQILAFDAAGKLLGKIDPTTEGTGQFKRPVGISTGTDGSVTITDVSLCKIIKYSPSR